MSNFYALYSQTGSSWSSPPHQQTQQRPPAMLPQQQAPLAPAQIPTPTSQPLATNGGFAQPIRNAQQAMPRSNGLPQEEGTRYNLPLTMAWFEYQKFGSIYDPDYGMKRGTLFPELDKPWLASKGGQ